MSVLFFFFFVGCSEMQAVLSFCQPRTCYMCFPCSYCQKGQYRSGWVVASNFEKLTVVAGGAL